MTPQDNQLDKPAPPQPLPFNWHFIATFKDGSKFFQDPLDYQPDRSSFKTVLERIDDVVCFELKHIDGKQEVLVDLISGNFMVNDTPLAIHNQKFEPQNYKLELVYFREKREQITQNVKTGELTDPKSFVNRYFIGWKTTVNGEEKQVTLAVA